MGPTVSDSLSGEINMAKKTNLSRRNFTAAGVFGIFGWAMRKAVQAQDLETYKRLGLHEFFDIEQTVNGHSIMDLMGAPPIPEDSQYNPCAEAFPGPDTPRGSIKRFDEWSESRIYADTRRAISIYIPEQLSKTEGTVPVIVFNDGDAYLDEAGPVRATAVLDSLIHSGRIKPTAGVFIMPGRPAGASSKLQQADGKLDLLAYRQRSFEYDSLTDAYVRFIVGEILPFAEREIDRNFSQNPAERTICGISSGGICAFNAAWHDPKAFGRVLSHCGSFTNIRGGHQYPYLVRSTERKPIRVFLQSGEKDMNYVWGDWALANQQMASALEFSGYDFKFVFGEGTHSLRHGGAIFADSLRWLWR